MDIGLRTPTRAVLYTKDVGLVTQALPRAASARIKQLIVTPAIVAHARILAILLNTVIARVGFSRTTAGAWAFNTAAGWHIALLQTVHMPLIPKNTEHLFDTACLHSVFIVRSDIRLNLSWVRLLNVRDNLEEGAGGPAAVYADPVRGLPGPGLGWQQLLFPSGDIIGPPLRRSLALLLRGGHILFTLQGLPVG